MIFRCVVVKIYLITITYCCKKNVFLLMCFACQRKHINIYIYIYVDVCNIIRQTFTPYTRDRPCF